MTGATLYPHASVRGPTTSLKSNVSPGKSTVPSKRDAASFKLNERASCFASLL